MKRIFIAIIACFAILYFLAESLQKGGGTNGAVNFKEQKISYYLEAEPPTLDTMGQATSTSTMISLHTFEGLLRYGRDGQLEPAVAESYELYPDGSGARFKLRQTAKWSDGQPVTAHDFIFAWKTLVSPEKASQYAFIMYSIKNAEAINAGKVALDQFGARAVGDWEIEVDFEKPCAYFPSLTTFISYMPCREDFYKAQNNGQKYASDADKMLYNGPFIMEKWVHNASIRLVKNPHYWDRDNITLNGIDMNYLIKDAKTRMNLFESHKICATSVDPETVKRAMQNGYYIEKFEDGALNYLEFNHRPLRKGSKNAMTNINLRKAILYAYDHQELINRVIATPGLRPGSSLYPAWLPGFENKFREEHPLPALMPNAEKAREHLALAKKELGLSEFPKFSFLVGDTPSAKKTAEYFQSRMQLILGLDFAIDTQTFKQRLAKSSQGDFDIVSTGWMPDFNDPMTYGELMASWNDSNRGRYNDPRYDKEIRTALNSSDAKERMEAMGRAQQIIRDDAVIIPLFEDVEIFVQHPRLVDVQRRAIGGDPDFRYARILEEK